MDHDRQGADHNVGAFRILSRVTDSAALRRSLPGPLAACFVAALRTRRREPKARPPSWEGSLNRADAVIRGSVAMSSGKKIECDDGGPGRDELVRSPGNDPRMGGPDNHILLAGSADDDRYGDRQTSGRSIRRQVIAENDFMLFNASLLSFNALAEIAHMGFRIRYLPMNPVFGKGVFRQCRQRIMTYVI